jgi:H+-transporting ATPase
VALLRSQSTQVRVLRDGHWQVCPAANLVPGDCRPSADGLSLADIRIVNGDILLDQSALTGSVEAGAGTLADAAANGQARRSRRPSGGDRFAHLLREDGGTGENRGGGRRPVAT